MPVLEGGAARARFALSLSAGVDFGFGFERAPRRPPALAFFFPRPRELGMWTRVPLEFQSAQEGRCATVGFLGGQWARVIYNGGPDLRCNTCILCTTETVAPIWGPARAVGLLAL